MNHRLVLNLIAIPTLASSLLTLLIMPSRAATNSMMKSSVTGISSLTQVSCDAPGDSNVSLSVTGHTLAGIWVASAGELSGEDLVPNFSAAESDAAVTLFGCDCLPCINALRLLRSNISGNNSQGHCWASLERRVSPQKLREVLQQLEVETNN